MPVICRFLAIIIAMYYREHNPPHFHVRYNDLALLSGKLPPKVFGLVIEWASQHQTELLEDWTLAEQLQNLKSIQPLE